MKQNPSRFLLLALAASCGPLSAASVSITFDFDSLRNSAGAVLSSSCVAVMVIDSDGDGQLPTASELLGINLSEGDIIGGVDVTSGDRIFSAALTGTVDFGPPNHAGTKIVDYTLNGADSAGGTIWGLYWFPTINSLGTKLTTGTPYGYFRNSTPDPAVATAFPGSNPAGMVIPAEGVSAINVFYFDSTVITAAGGVPSAQTPSIANYTASFVVVPEPATLTLSALGLVALLRRRR